MESTRAKAQHHSTAVAPFYSGTWTLFAPGLTDVGKMVRSDFEALKLAGCDDGEILEVNQVCAYFNYSNRLLNGLGCTTEGDLIGYYDDG